MIDRDINRDINTYCAVSQRKYFQSAANSSGKLLVTRYTHTKRQYYNNRSDVPYSTNLKLCNLPTKLNFNCCIGISTVSSTDFLMFY